MKNKQPIKKVTRINCPKCGELQIKIYPWSNIIWMDNDKFPICIKCTNKKAL